MRPILIPSLGSLRVQRRGYTIKQNNHTCPYSFLSLKGTRI